MKSEGCRVRATCAYAALVTRPERMHRVQARIRRTPPLIIARTT